MLTSGSPTTRHPYLLSPPAKTTNSTTPEHLTSRCPYFIALSPLPSRNPRLLIHRRTIAHSLPAASTSPDLLLRPHLPLPPPLETSRLLIHHCTTAHSVPAWSTAPDLLRRYSRQPPHICSGSFVLPTGDASSTPRGAAHRRPRLRPLILFADTFLLPELLRRHHRQPHRRSFAYTILNPTGAALPTHKSTTSDPLPCTLIQPTGAASEAPSMAADPHRRHHP